MIRQSQPLSDFLAPYRESGLDVNAFPWQDGDRYAIRVIDPGEPSIGLGFVAFFSSNIKEANRPKSKAARKAAKLKLDSILHDEEALAHYSACFGIIDSDTVKQHSDLYTAEDLGKSFIFIAKTDECNAYKELMQRAIEIADKYKVPVNNLFNLFNDIKGYLHRV